MTHSKNMNQHKVFCCKKFDWFHKEPSALNQFWTTGINTLHYSIERLIWKGKHEGETVNEEIDYCPFCGKKIKWENLKFKK